jgi:putative glycosyltransferase (TIGR04372 family)
MERGQPEGIVRLREALVAEGGIAATVPALQRCAAAGDLGGMVALIEAADGLGDLAPAIREIFYLLHQVFPVPATLAALRRLAPLIPDTEAVQNDLGFVLHASGDPEGAAEAFGRAAALLEERVARHPLASTGLRIIHPSWLIGSLGEAVSRLGMIAKLRALGLMRPWRLVLPAPREKIVNEPLLDLFAPHVTLVKEGDLLAKFELLAPDLALDTSSLPLVDGRFLYVHDAWRFAERAWAEAGRGPLLSLAPERVAAGRARLAEAGLPADAWYATVHVRDSGFHGAGEGRRRLDLAARDADLSTYLPAVQRVLDRGGRVVRLGGPSAPPLPAMPGVFDYAHSEVRSPELDVVLIASARLMIGTLSGPAHAASCFGVPTIHTNGFPSNLVPIAGDIWVPKLYRERRSGRLLSLAESISAPLRGEIRGSGFDDYGIDLVDNTAEDIADAVEEMIERLEGRPPADDPAVAETFRRTGNLFIAPISARFLARHRAALLPGT